MYSTPLVSIITPTYNHERFIGDCIQSVLNQTYPNWEQIIIDDGSTDRTGEIVRFFTDRRIRYVPQKHEGIWRLGATYNRGLSMANGEFIAMLEGDDMWPVDKLEKQIHLFDDQDIVMTWGKVQEVDQGGRFLRMIPVFSLKDSIWQNDPPGVFLKKALLFNPIPFQSVIIRKESLLKIGGFIQPSHLPYMDYPTWLQLSLEGKFAVQDSILGYYRRHPSQVTLQDIERVERNLHHYVLQFFTSLAPHFKKYTAITKKELLTYLQVKESSVSKYCEVGRVMLFSGEWRKARRYYETAFKRGNGLLRLKGLLGYTASIFHFDLEPMGKIWDKRYFR